LIKLLLLFTSFFALYVGFSSGGMAQTPDPVRQTAQQQTMRFFQGWSGGKTPAWIAAEGMITDRTPSDLRRWLQENQSMAGSTTVYFDSPGGNLLAGLELGLIIRERFFNTAVGRTVPFEEANRNPSWIQYQTTARGHCVSACAYAFLGGHNRSAAAGEIGFHQFYTERALKDALTPSFNAADLSQTQATVGTIALFLKELSIDPEVLFLASAQAPTRMAYPSIADMRRLRIINVREQPIAEPWRIEPVGQGAVVTTRIEIDAFTEVRMALHCRRSAPDVIVLRGAWNYRNPQIMGAGRPGSGQQLTVAFREQIISVNLMIGNRSVRSQNGSSGLIDARVDDDGTHRIAFGISQAEYRRGLIEGFTVNLELSGGLGYEQNFVPPIPGLSERMNIALRSCV
jgi:hypothetical protein